MSWQALADAARYPAQSAAEKLMLLAYADRHNDETGCAYPSIEWLCQFSSLNRKTVIAAITKLEAAGALTDTGDRMGKTKQIKVYRLSLQTVPKTEQSQKRNSPNFSVKQSQKRDTEPSKEPLPSEAKASSGRAKFPAPDGVPETVWRDFLSSPKRRKAGMSATAYAGIAGNLKTLAEHGFPPGKMIALAVERGWTTVKLEWVENDERKPASNISSLRGHRPDPALDLLRAARAAEDREDSWGAGTSLPSIGTG